MIEKPRRSLRRKIALAAMGLGGVFVVVTIAGLFWDPVSALRLSRRIKALRQAGEPLTSDEVDALLGQPAPEKNAAILFGKANDEATTHYDPALSMRLPVDGPKPTPAVGQPFPADMLKDIRTYLAGLKDELRLLHEAADLPACRFGPPAGIARLSRMRGFARLLALEALERQESGQDDEAAECLRAGLRVAHALRSDPPMLSHLQGIACDAITLEQVVRLAARAAASPAALQRVEAALRREMEPRMLEVALLDARACVLQWRTFSPAALLGPLPFSLADFLGVQTEPVKGILAKVPFPTAPLATERFRAVQALDAAVAAVRKPYPRSLIEGGRVVGEYERRTPRRCVLCGQYLSSLGYFLKEEQRMAARLESARAALAALRFRARLGKLPERLEDLVPDFLDALPPDPFNGKLLLYRQEAAGFVIYSPGSNGVDDGGTIELDQQMGDFPDVGFRVQWSKARP